MPLATALAERFQPTNVLVVLNPDGLTAIDSSRPPGAEPLDLSHREYFRAHKEGQAAGTYHVGPRVIGATSGVPIFHVSRARTGRAPEFDGVIAASVLVSYFTDFWKSYGQTPGDSILLVRTTGDVLAVSPDEDGAAPFLDRTLRRALADQMAGTRLVEGSEGGDDTIVAWRRIGDLPLSIVIGIGMSSRIDAWRQTWIGIVVGTTGLQMFLLWLALLAHQRTVAEAGIRRRLTEEINRRKVSEEAALRAQKMEAIGRLTGGVAHDINNILTAIGGNLKLIEPHTAPAARDRLEAAIAATASAGSITAQLLAFARQAPNRREPTDVGELVRTLQPLLEQALRTRGGVDLDLGSAGKVADVDPA